MKLPTPFGPRTHEMRTTCCPTVRRISCEERAVQGSTGGAMRWSRFDPPPAPPPPGRGARLAQRPAVLFQPLHQLAGFFFAFADAARPGELFVLLDGPLDSPARADHRAVVALAHPRADLREAELRRLANEEHRD